MLVFLLLLLGFSYSVHGQTLSMRWSNVLISETTDVDDRVLIYHDEIAVRTIDGEVPDGPGVLVCRLSERGNVAWFSPFSDTPIQSNNESDFRIFARIHGGPVPGVPVLRVQLARTRCVLQDKNALYEGLWTCKTADVPPLHVAIFARGNGVIETIFVAIHSLSLESDPPTFTLIGDTTGGPPTTAVWLRNGKTLNSSCSYNISIQANPNNTQNGSTNAHYQSTLVVTGMLPGVYKYQTGNRATNERSHNITIEGGNLTNFTVTQVGNRTVRVSWTPPDGPPSGGYLVIDEENGINRSVPFPPQMFVLPPGDYNFYVTYTSLHFPGDTVGPQAVTVLDVLPLMVYVSLSTDSTVIISWTNPLLRLDPTYYQLTLTGSSQKLCDNVVDSRSERVYGESANFTNLQYFSVYTVRVTAVIQRNGSDFSTFDESKFTTESFAPTGIARSKVHSSTSTSISVSWDEIECNYQNGPNISYEVDFQRLEGDDMIVDGTIDNQVFSVSGLQPFTVYTFRVRGVNDAGTGDYTKLLTILTDEEIPGPVSELEASLAISSYVVLSWSSPQEPRGAIIAYEITYSVNGSHLVTVNTTGTTTFTLKLSPSTRVSNISVRAYTSIGPGPAVTSEGISTLPLVRDCQARIFYNSAVVSWARSYATGYIVYYHLVSDSWNRQDEKSMTVPGTESSATIPACVLMSSKEYQFQIAATAEFRGQQIVGERSMCYGALFVPPPSQVPGPVSEFEASLAISSHVVLSWSSPQEPRGVIMAYEITYSVNGSDLVTVNTTGTTTFTLQLSPSTIVSNISVRAYTSIGPGPAVTSKDISTLPLVRNCRARIVNNSVLVSWAKTDATGYIVYYHFESRRNGHQNRQNEISMTVPGTESLATIPAWVLMRGEEYQFQIAATTDTRGQQIVGDRSMCSGAIISPSQPISPAQSTVVRDVGISAILLASTLAVAVLLGCAIFRRRSHQKMETDSIEEDENDIAEPKTEDTMYGKYTVLSA